jgi:hypothetical protein
MGSLESSIQTEYWHHKELHGSIHAMKAIALTASKVVRLPWPFQQKLEALPASLCHTCQPLGPSQVACYEAPEVW